MLEKLTALHGISGNEDAVRDFISQEIKDHCDTLETDRMGSLIAYKRGKNPGKKFMLSAHMDEVGLIVKNITDGGYLKFDSVGGVDSRVLLGKRVLVGEKRIPGVIGIRAVHMTTKEDRKIGIKMKDMYIDIGAKDKAQAQSMAQKGDYAAFDSGYVEFGNGRIKAKALDDRAGCALLIRLMKECRFDCDVWFCFTVQEETGLRGANVAARKILPDVALTVEGTVCADTFGSPEHLHVSTMGKGGVLSVVERTSRSDWELVNEIRALADKNNIPYQLKRTTKGGNDAGAIQIAGRGVKTAVISIPCRYIHSPVSVLDKEDLENTYRLLKTAALHIGG